MLNTLENDIIEAMKKKDMFKLTTLRMVKSAIKLQVINKKCEATDEMVLDVIVSEIKTRNESINEYKKANRDDLVKKTEEEVNIISAYLPVQYTTEEINQIIDEAFNEVNPSGPQDMGKIMKIVTPKLKGKADIGLISNNIKERLNK